MVRSASIARHPVHPMFVVFPIGLWVFSFAADIIYLAGGGTAWAYTAWYSMAGGIIGAVVAAVPGLVDLLARTHGRARTVGIWHMALNLTVLALFVVDFLIRTDEPHSSVAGFVLSCIGIAILVVSGWLGGALVYEHGIGIEAPLTEVPAQARARTWRQGDRERRGTPSAPPD